MVGITPALPAGFHDADMFDDDIVMTALEGAFESAPPITIAVEVANQGLAGTPLDAATEESVLALLGGEVLPDGPFEQALEIPVPEIAPGETTTIEIDLETPIQPVMARIAFGAVPVDRDPANSGRSTPVGP